MILLDTSGLLSCHSGRESGHDDALTLFAAAGPKLTHDLVLAEFVALAHARRLPRPQALTFLDAVLAHAEVEVVWVDRRLLEEAIALLRTRPDKEYSLCDAVSFVIMRQRGVTEALSTDHHFEQEGFRRLL